MGARAGARGAVPSLLKKRINNHNFPLFCGGRVEGAPGTVGGAWGVRGGPVEGAWGCAGVRKGHCKYKFNTLVNILNDTKKIFIISIVRY